jgi:hypothetical protein
MVGPSPDLLQRNLEKSLKPVIDQNIPAFPVLDVYNGRGIFQNARDFTGPFSDLPFKVPGIEAEFFFGLSKILFRLFSLRDIDGNRQRPNDIALLIPLGNGREQGVDRFTVFLDKLIGNITDGPGIEEFGKDC